MYTPPGAQRWRTGAFWPDRCFSGSGRLAGLKSAGVICQILEDDGSLALLPYLEGLAERQGIKIVSVTGLIAFRLRNESLVKRVAEEVFPTIHGGVYKAIVYRNEVDGSEHMALVKGDIGDATGCWCGCIQSVLRAMFLVPSVAIAEIRYGSPKANRPTR